jgi:RHS repeat-associated protein
LPQVITAGSTSYVYGPGGQPVEEISGTAPTYLLQDQQGSTRLLTNSLGAVTGTYSYGSYGTAISHTGTGTTALQYDGQYTDAESGYQYLRSRYYDPTVGQFLAADPAVALTGEPYQYGDENPLNAIDPTGLSWWSWSNIGTALGVAALGLGIAAGVAALAVPAAGVVVAGGAIGAVLAGGAIIAGGLAAGINVVQAGQTCSASGWGSGSCAAAGLESNINTLFTAAGAFIPTGPSILSDVASNVAQWVAGNEIGKESQALLNRWLSPGC